VLDICFDACPQITITTKNKKAEKNMKLVFYLITAAIVMGQVAVVAFAPKQFQSTVRKVSLIAMSTDATNTNEIPILNKYSR
jgi:hypothetical protein